MNLLAFDSSTEHLSIAAQHGAAVCTWEGAGGAQASASMIAAALRLLEQADLTLAKLDAIVLGRGPGAFTGLRTACAVAQGLAFGANCPVLPIDTLLAVAEQARHAHSAERVVALLDARMGEVYSAAYEWQGDARGWAERAPVRVSAPQALALPTGAGWALAGNAFEVDAPWPAAAAYLPKLPALPTAGALLRLAPPLLAAGRAVPAQQALPLYIRDKVALTTAERSAPHAVRP